MPNPIYFDQLGVVAVILCVAAFSTFVIFAFCEFIVTKKTDQVQFIDNIISFCMVWLAECMFIILICLYKYTPEKNHALIVLHIFAISFLTAVLAANIHYFKKNKLNLSPFLPVTLTVSLFTVVLIASGIPIHTSLKITIGLFILISMLFSFITIKIGKSVTKVGIIYTFGSACLMAVNNIMEGWWGIKLSLILDLALSLMMIMGFFLYYFEVYTSSIKDKLVRIQLKNRQLVEAEEKIISLAYTDQTTMLKNIYTLKGDLESLDKDDIHLIMISIDYYRYFSSLDGYNRTNAVLSEIVSKLRCLADTNDEIYHFYSDKLIFLCTKDHDGCITLIESIRSVFKNNCFCPVELTPNIGVTCLSDGSRSFDTLIRELDLATQFSYNNKLDYTFYNEQLLKDFQHRLELEVNLKSAVESKSWEMYFQPKVSVADNSIIGAEALIRWVGGKESTGPDIFVPMAEELGLIQEIGRFVIDRTFQHIQALNSLSPQRLNLAINLSPYQFMDSNFVEYILEAADRYSVEPENITFEMTESTLIQSIELINKKIKILKTYGFRFSLDDFGSGYSSISYLSRLHLDEIKFDKNFTSSLPHDARNLAILDGFMRIANELNIHVVMEGVEKAEQYDCIKKLGCGTYQGYYFSRPLPFDGFVQLLTA